MDLTSAYNYDSFVEENVNRWLNFAASPPLGAPAPDFELQTPDAGAIRLSDVWRPAAYTIIEFGSLT